MRPTTLTASALAILAVTMVGGCGTTSGIKIPFAPPNPAATPKEASFQEIAPQASTLRAMIVMYHDVVADRRSKDVWFDVTTQQLEEDLDEIEEQGGTIVSLRQLYEALTKGKPLPDKAVVLTFDDSYQGVYNNAFPLLSERKAPFTVFVHTGFIGTQGSKPKMTEETLKLLDSSGLVEIGSHTVTHPEDIGALSYDDQQHELLDSKSKLESMLGHKVEWLSWPTGNNDTAVRFQAQNAGYRLAVTMASGLAGASPGILQVNRYAPRSLRKGFEDMDALPPVRFAEADWSESDVDCRRLKIGRTTLVTLVGGKAGTVLVNGRRQVSELVAEEGAAGGVNGGFFSMAAVASTDNTMIGPCLTQNSSYLIPDLETERTDRIANRPLVAWNDNKIVFAPFSPVGTNDSDSIGRLLPDPKNVFVAGAWLVFEGRPLERDEIMRAASSDAMDPRKRVFFGISNDGRPIAGASENGADSARLAKAAAAAGARFAVLLDSGFSTSLVYQSEILAWGHRNASHGSRPIPHAILFYGNTVATLPIGEATEVDPDLRVPGTLPGSAGPRPR